MIYGDSSVCCGVSAVSVNCSIGSQISGIVCQGLIRWRRKRIGSGRIRKTDTGKLAAFVIFQTKNAQLLPILQGAENILFCIFELVRHADYGEIIPIAHAAEQIQVDFYKFSIGIRHVVVDKRVWNAGGS